MVSGRLTKYTPELLKAARYYMDNYQEAGDLVPSIAGMAVEIGVNRDTIHTWRKQEGKEIFSDMIDSMLSNQERKLLTGGLGGDMNSNITKLMLCKHGYSDKQETALTGPGGGPVQLIGSEMTLEQASEAYQNNLNGIKGT